MAQNMRILLVEDEVKTSQSIKQGLEEEHFDVDVAYDGHFGLRLATTKEYDLILTDVILPNKSGLELCRELRNLGKDMPIMMLTALGVTDDVVTGLDAGADDYMTKPFEFKELLARIRNLMRRSNSGLNASNNMGNVLRYLDIEMNLDTKAVWRAGKKIKLTSKEFALLEFFIRHEGKVVSKADIAEHIWEVDFDTGTNVIEVYISYLRNKIDRDFPKKLIHTQFGKGYIFKAESN